MKHIITIAVAAILFTSLAITPVFADTTEQEQSLETKSSTKVVCTSGSYGQNLNCEASADATASGHQKVIVRTDGSVVKTHTPVDAALDAKTMTVVMLSGLSGAAGIAWKIATRA